MVQTVESSLNPSSLLYMVRRYPPIVALPVRSFISGGSDFIGDISWKLPTVTMRYPSNIPGLQGHHWSNAVSMATPIAHKGVVAGAKAEAMTLLDFILKPELV